MIAAQFHFTHTDLARIFGAFQISYAITWLLGGIFLDAVGTRIGLALAEAFLVLAESTSDTDRSVGHRMMGHSRASWADPTGMFQGRARNLR